MRYRSSTLISGVMAFGIYIAMILLLIFYFNTRDVKKSVHYVKKNEDRISISMSASKASPPKQTQKTVKPKPKPIEKKVVQPKPKPKPIEKKVVQPKPKPKPVEKKVVKPKPIEKKVVKKINEPKKVQDRNITKPKVENKPKDLFANVTSQKKVEKPKPLIKVSDIPTKPKKNNLIKVSDKPSASDMVSNSLKVQKNSDSGIENAYLANIEEKLKGWPAQSEYAGEMAKVSITVQPSGDFKFKVITASGNEEFNTGLEAYLRQLQSIGFGSHKGDRAYELDVEFVATE